MTITIPEFWWGFTVGGLTVVALMIALAIIVNIKDKKGGK